MSQLQEASKAFYQDTNLTPIIGAEVEYYLDVTTETHMAAIKEVAATQGWPLMDIVTERGESQFEIKLLPSPAIEAAHTIAAVQSYLSTAYPNATLEAKPYANRPSSSMHIHISLMDQQQQWVFKKITDDQESPAMLHAIAGLIETMEELLPICCPKEADYKRFLDQGENPTHISWGGNNRTTAIRIPTSTINEDNRHIEYRLATSHADPELVIAGILGGIALGITQKMTPPPRIYGNAFDPQYAQHPYFCKPLAKSLEDAIEIATPHLTAPYIKAA